MRQLDVASEYKSYKEIILDVLKEFPFTRSSDTALYLKCCEKLGVKTIEDLWEINLNIVSIHKIRQQIQNKDGLFRPDEDVVRARKQRAKDIQSIMKK